MKKICSLGRKIDVTIELYDRCKYHQINKAKVVSEEKIRGVDGWVLVEGKGSDILNEYLILQKDGQEIKYPLSMINMRIEGKYEE